MRVRRSGAHYLLRHSDNGDFVRVSGDGSRYYDVPSRFFYSVLRKDGISLAELEGASFSPQEIADCLYTLVYKTGAFRLESSDA